MNRVAAYRDAAQEPREAPLLHRREGDNHRGVQGTRKGPHARVLALREGGEGQGEPLLPRPTLSLYGLALANICL